MAVAAARVGHEDRLSIVDHLSELRVRLIISLAALAVAFGLCMWQNHALLHIINKPLSSETQKQVKAGSGPLGATYTVQQSSRTVATQLERVVGTLERPGSGASPATRAALAGVSPQLHKAIVRLSKAPEGNKPVTLGIGEPFTTTIGIALIFAFILALPIILLQLYGFLLPAFSPKQQKIASSLTMSIPLLFVAGVMFGYFVVLPAAVRFFQNFNSGEFNVLVQANQYYHFAAVTLLAMGLVFQIPVAILAATRAGIVTPTQLRHNRRYALLACGAVAAFLPGDAVTLLLETVPLYLLFEASLVLASIFERRELRRSRADAA
ncbi:MAG: sec-independent protein translocase protein TatC [Solirubrobacteraceae bacterium]|jgi:sec-independent protein translocase protein TatC|nr:sec-independent protein translocase protein TatC [Solirubrobacteraceae bacterium]